jgi:ATP-binding cassette subfamily F protein 3
MKALKRMAPIAAATIDPSLSFHFPSPEALRPPLITLDHAAVGYTPGQPILTGLNLRIDPDDRIAILGRNGNGKTTLARLLSGQLKPMDGGVAMSGKLKVGYFTQHQVEELSAADTPFQHMARLMPEAKASTVRGQLGRFGFSGDKAEVEVSRLSGGERARLALALITRDAPHVIILDEPTNHLDVDTREALVEALNEYDGAVLIVSHDKHLLELTADRLVLVADGKVREFDGTLDDYRDMILKGEDEGEKPRKAESSSGLSKAGINKKDQRRQAAERRKETQDLRNAVKKAEQEVVRLTGQKTEIGQRLADPAVYQGDDAPALVARHAELSKMLDAAEECWLAAQEKLEAAEVDAA